MFTTTIFMIVELIELTIATIHVNIIYKDVYSGLVCCSYTESHTDQRKILLSIVKNIEKHVSDLCKSVNYANPVCEVREE